MNASVLVTGGTSGIGRTIAEEFLDRNWFVHLHYHQSSADAEALETQYEDTLNLIQADLRSFDECTKLAEESMEDKDLQVLINNAAVFNRIPTGTSRETDDWDVPMNVNARTPWHLSLKLSELLAVNEGSILNLTDAAVDRPYSDYLPYFASKGALETLTRGLARTVSPDVRVNGLAPGPIDFPDGYSESDRQAVIDRTLLQRQGRYEEIARTGYFLAVEATYTTGSILEVDGGRHLN